MQARTINSTLTQQYLEVRQMTENICAPLQIEDFVVQPVIDVSPPKWHLAHTTWFFETFILKPYSPNYKEFHPDFSFLFNSYYENAGKRVLRPNRGNMTRPTVAEVYAYRKYVDERMLYFLENSVLNKDLEALCLLGFNHEQQHQELLVTDIKYILGGNPLFPALQNAPLLNPSSSLKTNYLGVEAGVYTIGYEGNRFHFDNELGVHKVYLHAFRCQDRLITNGEYLEFMEAGAYQDFNLWLAEALDWVKTNQVVAPMYWHLIEGEWYYYTLNGLQKVDLYAPVTHVSFYEAEAYSRWRGMRLLTEFEWEVACNLYNPTPKGTFLESQCYAPMARQGDYPQFLGDVWEWTNSSYLPYPFFQKASGAIGEYNGKFMINQMVLRGGSCATPQSHIRHTYRNFFQTNLRWQFTGIRLAEHI
jgi:ergothioneine biosynthesis protein EgtB